MGAVEREAARTDEQLASGAAAGDEAAFRELAERYSRPAFAYAFHLLGGYDDAEDAAQEALIQVYLALPASRHDLPFRPWFYQVLRRKCLDALRRRRTLRRLPPVAAAGDPDEGWEDYWPDPAPLPEELHERRDVQRVLHQVIGELEPKYRDVVLLRYATDLTFEEMGAVLGLPVNTVKTHFQRAKRLLRPLLLAQQLGPDGSRRPTEGRCPRS